MHFPDNFTNENSSEEGEKPKEHPNTKPSKTHKLLTAIIKNSCNDCEWIVFPLCKPPNLRKQLNKLALQCSFLFVIRKRLFSD